MNSSRAVYSKKDLRLLDFDKSQVMIYKKIREAKSNLDTVSKIKSFLPLDSIRRLKYQQIEQEKKSKILQEN